MREFNLEQALAGRPFMAHIKKTGWIARYKFPKDENCCFSNFWSVCL
jgi:hypothetical protein